MQDCRRDFCLYCKEPHKTGDKKICEEYKMEATNQNKMRLDKCDAYTAKEILGYRGRKSYVSVARGATKREEKQRRTEEETSLQINYRSPSIKRRVEPMKNQNREKEEKDSDNQKPKIAEDKDTKEKVKQRNRTEERNIKIGNTFSVLQEDDQEPILVEQLSPITKINKEEKKKLKEGEERNWKIPKQKERK